MSEHESVDALVVGAGFSGLYQLHRLRSLNLSTVVVEAGSGVGGTWFWNRYPGARCDVESMSYSYSFSPELEQEWEWTEKYPAQPQLLQYLEHVADRFDLRRHIVFDTRVTAAEYDETSRRWRVATDTGCMIDAQFLIMATGCLSASKAPEVPGAERFAGRIVHTGHWPREGADLTGRRVAVIGTGSSGIQVIPPIAELAAELTVFQRTANFALPARNRPLTTAEVTDLKDSYREFRKEQRDSVFGVPVPLPAASALAVDEAERSAVYEEKWRAGSLLGLLSSYADLTIDAVANDTAAEFIRGKIRSIVADKETAELLSPRSYPLGTKRPCLDTGYYNTFNLPHVRLVDLRSDPLVEITEGGVRTVSGEHEVDDIVFATGFDAMTGALTRVDIRGRSGESLTDHWKDGATSYLGLAVAGFPNLFTVTGPGSPSTLSNMIVSIEQHVEWISDCIVALRERGATEIEATSEAENTWSAHVAELAEATLYPRADSWFLGANVPGKARMFMVYLGGVGPYRERCTEIAEHGYDGFQIN